MKQRTFGRTGLQISVLTFGCGAVGGLMTKGAPADQERAFARALEAGINHFDTAADYGDGASETNVGRVLAALKPDIILSTKVRVPAERPDIGAAIAASLEASLRRLKRDHVDVFQLHNTIGARSRRHDDERRGSAGRRRAGVEQGARAGQDALHRLHGDRRDRRAASRDRIGCVRQRAGAVQRAQSERGRARSRRPIRRRTTARILDLAAQAWRRHHRHPRARGRRAVGQRGARPARHPVGRADRLGRELCGGRCARAAARTDGARGPCRKPDRDGDALCHRAPAIFPPPRSGLPTSASSTPRSLRSRRGRCRMPRSRGCRQLQAGFLGEAR